MIRMIAFDFDGTLADSVDFCLLVFMKVLKKYMGENAPSEEEVYQNFGMNEPGVLRFFMGKADPDAEADFFKLHRELHAEKCPEPFPGVVDLLKFLRSKGVRLGVLTGRAETSCHISLDALDLNEYFDFFCYGDPDRNDKAGQMKRLLEENGLRSDEFAYVGDAVSDVLASQRAGVKCYAAAWAKTARIAELEKLDPGYVFRTVADMQKVIAAEL